MASLSVFEFDSASCLPSGLCPRLDRRDAFRFMSVLPFPVTIVACVAPVGIPASYLTLAIALTIASVTDIGHRKIYNWTTYPVVATAIVLSGVVSVLESVGQNPGRLGSIGLAESFAGIAVCGTITFIAYIASRGGAGDVKLAAAVGGILGPELGMMVIATAYVLAASFALVATCVDGSLGRLLAGLTRSVVSRFTPLCPPANSSQSAELNKTMPLAGFFALATTLVVLGN